MRTEVLVAISLVLVLSLPSLFFLPVRAASIFSDGFESGNFSAWTETLNAPVVQSTITHSGTYAAQCLLWSHPGADCFNKTLASTYTNLFVRIYIYLDIGPTLGNYITFIVMTDDSSNLRCSCGYSNLTGVNQVSITLSGYLAYFFDYTITPGQWHSVELEYDANDSVHNLWIDSNLVGSVSSAQTHAIQTVLVGYFYASNWDQTKHLYVDDVEFADAYIGPEADTTAPTFGSQSTNTTLTNTLCEFLCLVNDNVNVSAFIFSTNNTGTWTNDTAIAFSSFVNATASWANVTKTLNDTVGNVVSYAWYANDTSNNWGSSDQYNLTVTAPYRPNLQLSPDTVTCRKLLETFDVQINVTNAVNTQGFTFTIYYDASVLNFSSVTWGELGTGTLTTIDRTGGIIEGNVAGSSVSGNLWLLNITFQADQGLVWKEGSANQVQGRIWFHQAQLEFSDSSVLQYAEGGINQIGVNQAAYTFLPIKGDVNNDGTVDVLDLRAVAFYYDKTPADPEWPEASKYDLKPDNTIDIFDLVIVASNFGFKYP